ncbi:hypothetical protein HAZT_HAZT007196 [Hyalella azteca]|uniref:Focal AT domain-containing protein n=1 Tax=Hyalella azteca TaxID=294128 RepID=A0A6A0H6H8_HYAAZ|nr:hypothetical protein HAZT_HAZT007196 [Hyalella azteca]
MDEEEGHAEEMIKRESRRLTVSSWGGADEPPPKPARTPLPYMESNAIMGHPNLSAVYSLSQVGQSGAAKPVIRPGVLKPGLRKKRSLGGGDSDGGSDDFLEDEGDAQDEAPITYIVAETPEVLSRLMKENKKVNAPGSYSTPAAAINTMKVAFESNSDEQPVPLPSVASSCDSGSTKSLSGSVRNMTLASLASGYGYSGFVAPSVSSPSPSPSDGAPAAAAVCETSHRETYGCRDYGQTQTPERADAAVAQRRLSSSGADYGCLGSSGRGMVGYGGVVGVGGLTQSTLASAASSKNFHLNSPAPGAPISNLTNRYCLDQSATNVTAMTNSTDLTASALAPDSHSSSGTTYGSLPHYHQYQKQQQQINLVPSTLPHSSISHAFNSSGYSPHSLPGYPQDPFENDGRYPEVGQPIYDGVLGLPGGPNPPYAQNKSQMMSLARSRQLQPNVMDQHRAFMQNPASLPPAHPVSQPAHSMFQSCNVFPASAHQPSGIFHYPSGQTGMEAGAASPKSGSLRRGLRSLGGTLDREHSKGSGGGGTLERGRSAGGTLERGGSLGGTQERGRSPGGTLERGRSPGSTLERGRSPGSTLERGRSPGSTLERGRSPGGTLERGRSPGSTLERGRSIGGALERMNNKSPGGTLERERTRSGSASGTLERGVNRVGAALERSSSSTGASTERSGGGSPYYSPSSTLHKRAGSNPPMPAPGAGFHHAGYNDWAASGVGYEVHEPSTTDVAELERRLTETRLKEQQRQMREDNKWLAQAESSQRIHGHGKAIAADLRDASSERQSHLAASADETAPKSPNLVIKPPKPTPTANLDRTNDHFYELTKEVVLAVTKLNKVVSNNQSYLYVQHVMGIGTVLRNLLAAAEPLMQQLPDEPKNKVAMAHQVLSKDMKEAVEACRVAEKNSNNVLSCEYNKRLQAAAHVVAMDSKNLLDVIDEVRLQYGLLHRLDLSSS